MQIHLGRNGQPLGIFSIEQVLGGIRSGQLLPTDIAWHEGLADWQPLSSLTVLQQPRAEPLAADTPKAEPRREVQPVPARAMAANEARPSHPPSKPQPDDGAGRLAAWSFGLGIASLLMWLLTAIPSLICGHIALRRFKKRANKNRRWMAVAGLVLSYSLILIPIAGTAVMYPFIQDGLRAHQSQAAAIALVAGCKAYARDHSGSLPADLNAVIDPRHAYLVSDHPVRCPLSDDENDIGYHYFGSGMRLTDPGDKVVLISKGKTKDGRQVVARLDGTAELMAVPELPRGR